MLTVGCSIDQLPHYAKDGAPMSLPVRRTNLVVPAHLVPALQIPSLSVTTGEADPEWVEVPMSTWRFRRRPAQRLPLDGRSAKRARRYVRLAPWPTLTSGAFVLAAAVLIVAEVSGPFALLTIAAACLNGLVWHSARIAGELPRQVPYRTRSGDLRIPDVPVEVAQQWTERNPGVFATDEPAPRPFSRRFYAAWSVLLVTAAIGLGAVLANNGREDSFLLWLMVLALFFTGASMALKMLPPGYVRFEHDQI